jgi:formate hydrogenlyase transcriptional activator
MSRYGDAIRAGREGLALFGIVMPQSEADKAAALESEIAAIRRELAGTPIASLIDLPVLSDPQVKLCMRLLMNVWASAYIAADADLIDWIAAKMVRLSLAHGNTEESASGYVIHGITVGSRLGDYAAGHEFGKLALRVNERFDDLRSRAKVCEQFGCFVNHWREPLRDCMAHTQRGYRSGLESGDFTYATYSIFVESWYGLLVSRELRAFQREYGPVVGFLRQIKYHTFADLQQLILNWGLALQGATGRPGSLSGDGFDERAYRKTAAMPFFLVFYYVPKLHLLYTSGHYRAACAVARKAEGVIGSLTGTIWPALLLYYQALTLTALYPAATDRERREYWSKLQAAEARLRIWAENCPESYRHRHLLVAAEMARVEGRHSDAIEHYEAAIRAAERSDFLHDLALANELYGKLWRARGQDGVAAVYLSAAYRTYERWGAAAKVRDLLERHADVIRPGTARGGGAATTALATTEAPAGTLDFFTVLKATQAIAGRIDLSQLLATLLRILLENAGAQRGFLLLGEDGKWSVQAEGTAGSGDVRVLHSVPVQGAALAATVVNYVRRTAEHVVLADASSEPAYASDPYVARHRPRSVLCAPVLNQGRLIGAIYLENNLTDGAFTAEHTQMVQILAAHAAGAIRNAQLFAEVSRLRDRLQAENVYLHEEIKTQRGFEEIIGQSPALRRVLRQVERVAPTDTTVLITGETGTGKELIARAIHELSGRKGHPLIALNCGAISPGLVESELFGHEKGAFTGALRGKIGRFELADGGTIFLDEIGDLTLDLQVKLLRVLQEGEFERVGGTKTIQVDVRVIAATHQPLDHAVHSGRFRPDLYYRLNVFPVHVPPLRDRPEDIPLLVRHFVLKNAAKLGRKVDTIPKPTLDALVHYAWPGNVRELRNVIERSVILSTGTTLELGEWITGRRGGPEQEPAARTLADMERDYILQVLLHTGWRVSGRNGAAKILGLKPTTLEARMKKLGITRPNV